MSKTKERVINDKLVADKNKKLAVFFHSSEDMKELNDNSVGLVVTSPPYFVMRGEIVYEGETDEDKYQNYLNEMERVFKECYRVLEEGRIAAINSSDYIYNGSGYDVPADLSSMMRKVGFDYEDNITWIKPSGQSSNAGSRAGSFVDTGWPLAYRPNKLTESIKIFRKGEIDHENERRKLRDKFAGSDEAFRNEFHIDYRKLKDKLGDVWEMTTVRRDEDKEDHPARFPVELPKSIIQLYSVPGDIVLDPFLGSGTTLKAVKELNSNISNKEWYRKGAGYEINNKWKDRIVEKLGINSRSLDEF